MSNDFAGVERRLVIFRFNHVFRKGDADFNPHINSDLATDECMSALLNMAIDGYKSLIANKGFISTKESERALDEFVAENDSVIQWLNKMFQWCVQQEYIRKNYAENLIVPKVEQQSQRRAFTREHIELLWSVAGTNPNVPIVLMLLYCGVRINELLNLKKEDVNLDEQWFRVRASKTNAGIRIVPIADKVLPFWQAFMERSRCSYAVCTTDGEQLTYDNFRKNYWHPLMDKLNMDYIPHETRHTCNSLLIMSNCNPTIRKKIMGHKSQMDIGEAVYGHIYTDELLKAINQI